MDRSRRHRTQPKRQGLALALLCGAAFCLVHMYSGMIMQTTSNMQHTPGDTEKIPRALSQVESNTTALPLSLDQHGGQLENNATTVPPSLQQNYVQPENNATVVSPSLQQPENTTAVPPSLQHNEAEPESSIAPAATGNSTFNPNTSNPSNIFFIWLGNNPLGEIQAAAMDSCRKMNENDFTITIVRDADLETLGFELHPLFRLLDPVQKSDYLRQELLHFYGGIYLDTDVFCMRPLAPTLDRIIGQTQEGNDQQQAVVGGGSPDLPYGDLRNNMLGPNLKLSSYSNATHEALWKQMDKLTDKLNQCAVDFPDGAGGIAYPAHIGHEKQLCGTRWGVMIDFNMRRTRQAYKQGTLVETFERCEGNSNKACDLLHIGCAKRHGRLCKDRKFLCRRMPLLRKTNLCTGDTTSSAAEPS